MIAAHHDAITSHNALTPGLRLPLLRGVAPDMHRYSARATADGLDSMKGVGERPAREDGKMVTRKEGEAVDDCVIKAVEPKHARDKRATTGIAGTTQMCRERERESVCVRECV